MSAIQAIRILGHEERAEPKPHDVYKIEIQASVRSWLMWRRYSEFVDLNTELTKLTKSPPPAQLPPKHAFSILKSIQKAKILQERLEGLEEYLRAILSSKDDKWRETYAFREFLGVPVGKQGRVEGGLPSQFTSASWLDEHLELQTRIRDVRADINKRDALSDRGDINASHKANVEAKRRLAGVLSRIANLGKGLNGLAVTGMSEGELQRRTDMVARLKDDCEKLGKMVTVARNTSRAAGGHGIGTSADMNPARDSDRDALLDGPSSKPVTRVFGTPAVPKETEETRPLDDRGLLQLQNNQMELQDTQLSQLTTILQRQRQLGEAIGQEVAIQIEALGDLDTNVDRVTGKLTTENRRLHQLG